MKKQKTTKRENTNSNSNISEKETIKRTLNWGKTEREIEEKEEDVNKTIKTSFADRN